MPANSIAAIGVGDLGENVGEAIDTIDEQGIPGEVPPNQLKKTLKKAGIDIDQIAGNLGDAAVFAQGRTEKTPRAAPLVIEAKDADEAQNTVSNIGTLLRSSGTPGSPPSPARRRASRSAAPSSAPSRWSSPPKTSGSRSATACRRRWPASTRGRGTLSKTKAYNEALELAGRHADHRLRRRPPGAAPGRRPAHRSRRKRRTGRTDALPEQSAVPGDRLGNQGRRRPGEADPGSHRVGGNSP